jgi:anaerobic dimethyl sulfoxide reductase subunit C (anchor subunit)
MNVREWALITFSILAQMSVGAFVVLGIAHFFAARKAGEQEADRLSDRALLAIGPVLVLGLLASILHLGNPLNAPRAIMNFATSWLSREILFGVLFAGLGAAFALAQWRKIGTFALRNALAWGAALVGLALVYSMAQVYMLDTQPAWNTLATPVLFYVTTFLLGGLAVGAAMVANYAYVKSKEPACAETQCTLLRETVRWIAVFSLALLGIELIAIPLQMAFLTGSAAPQAAASVALTYNQFGVAFGLRLALAFVGAGLFALFLYRNTLSAGRERTLGYFVYGAFALVLAAEVMGRFLFYASHLKIGI